MKSTTDQLNNAISLYKRININIEELCLITEYSSPKTYRPILKRVGEGHANEVMLIWCKTQQVQEMKRDWVLVKQTKTMNKKPMRNW